MSSNSETDDTDKEICELLDPNRIVELNLSRNVEMDSNLNRELERKRNIVKRQISFNKKSIYRYVPLGCQDSNQDSTSGSSTAARQDPFKILVYEGPGKHSEVDLNRLISINSNRFSCHFRSVIDNLIRTWKNICDLQPVLDETISAFRILPPKSSNQVAQKAFKDTNEKSENPLSNDNIQSQDLKEMMQITSSQTGDNEKKDFPSPISQKTDVPEKTLSSDIVKNVLDLPKRKLREDSAEIGNLIAAKSFDLIFLSNYECQNSFEKVEGKKSPSTTTENSSMPEIEIRNSTSTKVEPLLQKDEKFSSETSTKVEPLPKKDAKLSSETSTKVEPLPEKEAELSESSTEKEQVRDISISSRYGQSLNEVLDKLDRHSSQAEPLYQSLINNLSVLSYPGDHASSEATIRAIEYNLNHRILQFHKDVPKLQRNVVNFFNRIECLVRKWPLNTSIRTLKQYLAFVLHVESKVVKLNLLSLTLKYKIESDRLRSLSGRSSDKNENPDYSFNLYKKYYMAVKYISVLEELRALSEKFYSYIVKPLPSFLV